MNGKKFSKNQDILVCIIGPLYKFMKKTSMSKFNLNKSKLRCYEYRKRILEISQKVTALHIGGAFSSGSFWSSVVPDPI